MVLAPQPPEGSDIATRLQQAKDIMERHNYSKAIALYNVLANDGNVEAEAYMADAYRTGKGVAKDLTTAAHWIVTAAAAGDLDSEQFMADAYQYESAQKEAASIAAPGSTGNTALDAQMAKLQAQIQETQEKLKVMMKDTYDLFEAIHAAAPPVGSDEEEYAKWTLRAADQGLFKAQATVVKLYFQGVGVSKSVPQAYKWSLIASVGPWGGISQKVNDSFGLYKTLTDQMTPEQIADAKKQAEAWQPTPIPVPPLPTPP